MYRCSRAFLTLAGVLLCASWAPASVQITSRTAEARASGMFQHKLSWRDEMSVYGQAYYQSAKSTSLDSVNVELSPFYDDTQIADGYYLQSKVSQHNTIEIGPDGFRSTFNMFCNPRTIANPGYNGGDGIYPNASASVSDEILFQVTDQPMRCTITGKMTGDATFSLNSFSSYVNVYSINPVYCDGADAISWSGMLSPGDYRLHLFSVYDAFINYGYGSSPTATFENIVVTVGAVPEPAAMSLALACFGLLLQRRR